MAEVLPVSGAVRIAVAAAPMSVMMPFSIILIRTVVAATTVAVSISMVVLVFSIGPFAVAPWITGILSRSPAGPSSVARGR
jgi:hypothetical protein